MQHYLNRSRRAGGVILGLAGLVLIGGSLVAARAQQVLAPAALVFDGVTVIDVVQGRRFPGQRVVIVGNRIRSMGSGRTVRIPARARVVDARGKYLIPGLWDMHAHMNVDDDYYPLLDVLYPMLITGGVTGIRDPGSPKLAAQRQWRQEILAGTRVGPPRQILSGDFINGADQVRPQYNSCEEQRAHTGDDRQCVIDSADVRHLVDARKAAGSDMIKLYSLPRAMYFVAAAEARRIGIPFGGHILHVTAIEASDSGASIVDHAWGLGEGKWMSPHREECIGAHATVARCQVVAEHFRRHGTWLVVTWLYDDQGNKLFLKKRLRKLVEDRWLAFARGHPTVQGNWLSDSASGGPSGTTHPDSVPNILFMRQVGLPLLLGTDASPGEIGDAVKAELKVYVAEGLTPLEALQTATLNPAKLLHATDSLGTVAPGKLADLVLLDADPLADITNTTLIRGVVANGRYFDRDALDQLLVRAHEVLDKLKSGK